MAGGEALAFVYFENEPGRRASMKRMSKEDARRLADQLVRLPDVVEELRQQREARPYPKGE
jgi:hypothetical protein